MAKKEDKANAEAPETPVSEATQDTATDNSAENTAVTDEVSNNAADASEEQTAEAAPEQSHEEALQAQLAELNDKYLRLYSDFENFRKRTNKEKLDLMQSGGTDVVKTMLPVLDDFERAIASNEESEDLSAIKEGVKLVHHKLHQTLVQRGLKEIESMDQDFDLDVHEAVTKIPMPDKKGKVVDVLEKGYYLNDKVIRYAKVVIGD